MPKPEALLVTDVIVRIEHSEKVKKPGEMLRKWFLSNKEPLPEGITTIKEYIPGWPQSAYPIPKEKKSEVYLGKVEPYKPKEKQVKIPVITEDKAKIEDSPAKAIAVPQPGLPVPKKAKRGRPKKEKK